MVGYGETRDGRVLRTSDAEKQLSLSGLEESRSVTRERVCRQEDPLEKGKAAHSGILAWRTPWTEEPGGLQCLSHKESDTAEQLRTFCQVVLTNT